jgi:nickel superoxide dismutase
MKRTAFSLALFLFITTQAFAHCQIPCGIYDDEARLKLISEHITTIEKSMKSIIELSAAKDINYNQIVRWVNNKETHATYIQDIVSEYFMYQRLTPVARADAKLYADYIDQLTLLHQMGVYAMKAKQGLDLSNVQKLRQLLESFKKAYFKK